ncbi:AMP-binding protein [Rhodobacteraceae bacterium B1Z28]|uniref:AMP-binding protein n=1 Tax=Ruegeria haliotis TaxID=2747601 RepID=A0ABX2PTH6_9RHOB|nr:AMP-binding protein [Ruegeria haliotis]NVO57348.1 AMP-binding protein [Ruegeria haliotis]
MLPLDQPYPEARARAYRNAGYWTGETFPQLLRKWAEDHPSHPAIIDASGTDPRVLTYGELQYRAERFGAGLLAQGLKPGARVVVQLPNCVEFFVAVFGLFAAGMQPVFALPAHRQTEIAHFLTKAEAEALIIQDTHDGYDCRVMAQGLQKQCSNLSHVFVKGDADVFTAFETVQAQPIGLPADPAPSSVAFLLISGGSTGLPKLIPRTHDDYLYSIRESARICGLSASTRYLAVLPVSHNFTLSSPGSFGTLLSGGCVVLPRSSSAGDCLPLIEYYRVTIAAVVPPLAQLWLNALKGKQHDLTSLRVLQVGGAKLQPEIAMQIEPALGCRLQQVFGMAEGLVNYTRLDDPEDIRINTQGRPISKADEVRVVDDTGDRVPVGLPGHLQVRGPYTICTYHNDDGANARSFTDDGFYCTGDIVSRDDMGNLTVQGRAGDHINRAGEKFSAEEVENHILALDRVMDVAIVSIPDASLGERSCAFVEPRTGVSIRPVEIRKFLRKREIAPYKIPDEIEIVSSLQKTAVGKLSRKDLRQQLRSKHLSEKA